MNELFNLWEKLKEIKKFTVFKLRMRSEYFQSIHRSNDCSIVWFRTRNIVGGANKRELDHVTFIFYTRIANVISKSSFDFFFFFLIGWRKRSNRWLDACQCPHRLLSADKSKFLEQWKCEKNSKLQPGAGKISGEKNNFWLDYFAGVGALANSEITVEQILIFFPGRF